MIMKHIFSIIIALSFCFGMYAQSDVTRFLDIPIEGKKSEIIKKIKAKGFKTAKFANDKVLTGKFNGQDVYVDAHTNDDNEVYRIIVWDKNPCNERTAKIRFNNLCYQFKENSKYISNKDWTIPDDDDISYELRYGKKNYQAVFFQWPTELGDSIIRGQVLGQYFVNQLQGQYEDQSEEARHIEIEKIYMEKLSNLSSKKRVWFTILENEPYKYSIVMYYENAYNMANGEDL